MSNQTRLLAATALLLGSSAAAGAGDIVGRVTAGGRPVRDAVVFVEELRSPPVQARATMDQRNRTFIPHVMAVQIGTRVLFPNHDTVFHNVFSYREGKRFDLGLYPVGKTRLVTFDQPGLVRIFCNIHSNMSAFIWVVENSFFDKSDSSGQFRLAEVPAGERSVQVWSERFGSRRLQLSVPRVGSVRVDVPLSAR
jgi:plastocyanin